jgi:hypothetical protein
MPSAGPVTDSEHIVLSDLSPATSAGNPKVPVFNDGSYRTEVASAGRARQHARRVRSPDFYARTGTLAVRSSLPQLTQAPLIARRIAFQTQ